MSAEIKEYIESLDYNADEILEVRTEEDKKQEEISYDEEDGKTFKTTRVEYTVTKNLKKLPILGNLEGVIFPGNLVRADSKLVDGKPSALTHQDRTKCTLTITLPKEETSSQVYPSFSHVHEFIQANEKAWFESHGGSVEAGSLDISCVEAHSKEQVSFSLGLKGQMGNDSISTLLNVTQESEKRVCFAKVQQVFYSVVVDCPKSPETVFADSLSIEDAKSAFSSESPPAYIGQVAYGRLTVIKMETKGSYSAVDMEVSMQSMIEGVKVDGTFKSTYESIKENSSFSLIAFGGNAKETIEVFKDFTQFKAYLTEGANLTESNRPKPISYTTFFLKDNSLATIGDACKWVESVRKEVFVGWRNRGAFTARFSFLYKKKSDGPDGPDHKVKTDWIPCGGRKGKFSLGNAYDIRFKVDVMFAVDQWKCIIDDKLPSPNNKYLTAFGTTIVPQWEWEN
mmetsp:Transcript_36135/g.86151  ORF Transcript_36135/g.86151 Transcript_36135/m.86151 type:complete len:454 (-) Transcript_36135:110-1471(-)